MIFSQILFNFFDPNYECFAKCHPFCSHIFDYSCLWRRLIAIEEVRNYSMEKSYRPTSKTFSKMAGGRMHSLYPSSYPLDPPLAIGYKNHQKSLTYFSHLIGIISFVLFLLKGRVTRGGSGGGHGTMRPPKYASDSTPSIS